jgi:hypothetical protein
MLHSASTDSLTRLAEGRVLSPCRLCHICSLTGLTRTLVANSTMRCHASGVGSQ